MILHQLVYQARATLPPDKDGKTFNYEIIGATADTEEGEDPVSVMAELKEFVHSCITWPDGTPVRFSKQSVKTPNVTVASHAKVNASAGNEQRDYSKVPPCGWDGCFCKFQVPYKVEGKDMVKIRKGLARAGCFLRSKKNFPNDPDIDNCWYAPQDFDGSDYLSEYKIILNPVESDEDDIPF